VVGYVKTGVINPYRRSRSERGAAQPLAQTRRQVGSTLDVFPDPVQVKAPRPICQAGTVNDGKGGHVHWHPMVLEPQVAGVQGRQTLEAGLLDGVGLADLRHEPHSRSCIWLISNTE